MKLQFLVTHRDMCTYHDSRLKKAKRHAGMPAGLFQEMARCFETLRDTGISPKDIVPVLTGEQEVVPMSWGFRRRFKRKDGTGLTAAKPVVNAQSEKMHTFMWREAYESRRCIVPVTAFYEWTGPAKAKITHRFHRNDDAFFVAGLWENHPEHGPCHTMLTTEPNREVLATGHDRCLVVLLEHEIDPWLRGVPFRDFHRPDGMLQVESPVPNPRERPKPPPAQGELF